MSNFFCKVAVFAIATFVAVLSYGNDYAPVGWIKADGNQWIHTGYKPACTDTIEMKVEMSDVSFSQCFWCSRGTSGTTSTFTSFLLFEDSIAKVRFDYSNNTSTKTTVGLAADTQYILSANGATKDCSITKASDGTCVAAVTMVNSTFTPVSSFSLFASHMLAGNFSENTAKSKMANFGTYKLYYFRVFDAQGNMKLNLIPVENKAVTEAGLTKYGLYDTVSGEFKQARGDGSFTAGGESDYRFNTESGAIQAKVKINLDSDCESATINGEAVENGGYVWATLGQSVAVNVTAKEEFYFYQCLGLNSKPVKYREWSPTLSAEGAFTFTLDRAYNIKPLFAQKIFVSSDATGTGDGSSIENAYTNIQVALNAAGAGDTVVIAPGVYETHKFGDTNQLYSIDVPADVNIVGIGDKPEDTVIDGSHTGRIMRLAARAYATNLTIANSRLHAKLDDNTRGMAIDARANALVENVVITNCQIGAVKISEHYIYLNNATMRNCLISNFKYTGGETAVWGANTGCALYVADGSLCDGVTVQNCAIKSSASVIVTASTATNITVRCNTLGYVEAGYPSSGVRLSSAALLTDSLIESNRLSFCAASSTSAGGVNSEASVIDRCVIRGNEACTLTVRNTPGGVGGVCLTSTAVMRNSLVVGNKSSKSAAVNGNSSGGVTLIYTQNRNPTVENCTIINNSFPYNTQASGVRIQGGTIVNSIIHNNSVYKTGGEIKYSLVPTEIDGEGNIIDEPQFKNPQYGDYSLSYTSPCIDAGCEISANVHDFDGRPRPIDGNIDGIIATDIGCYEMPELDEGIICALIIDKTLGAAPFDATVSANVKGKRLTGLKFTWTCIGDCNGQITEQIMETTSPTCTFQELPAGNYSFRVDIVNDHTPQDTATDSIDSALLVSTANCYVSPTGGNVWPYDTPETAAKNIADAIANAVERVILLPGIYTGLPQVTDSATANNFIAIIDRPLSIEGTENPFDTVLDCEGGGGFMLKHPEAKISGFAIYNFMTNANTAALSVVDGVASNIAVWGKSGYVPNTAYPITVSGFMTDCVITNVIRANNAWSGKGMMSVVGGVVQRTKFTNNSMGTVTTLELSNSATRGRIANCLFTDCKYYFNLITGSGDIVDTTIRNCKTINNGTASLVSVGGGMIINRCIITNNVTANNALLSMPTWSNVGTIKNTLIAKNSAKHYMVDCGDVDGYSKLTNVTFADNVAPTGALTARNLIQDNGSFNGRLTAINCLFYGNSAKDIHCTSKVYTIANCNFAEKDDLNGTGNIYVDPCFKKRGEHPYALKGRSPCIDAGQTADWLETDVDIQGTPRIKGRKVDIGCYESVAVRGFRMIVR